ncbi:MAG TPA: ParB/RepB/Spo0J family partition protein [Leptolyngbyaceae cyanobacterium]
MAKSRQSLAQSLTPSIAQKFIADPDSAVTTQTAKIAQIKLPQSQPRRYFDSEKMAQLIESIQEHGVLEPLLVRPLPGEDYELVAGERRLRAA